LWKLDIFNWYADLVEKEMPENQKDLPVFPKICYNEYKKWGVRIYVQIPM